MYQTQSDSRTECGGTDALTAAIASGSPVPTNPAQAAELVALAKHPNIERITLTVNIPRRCCDECGIHAPLRVSTRERVRSLCYTCLHRLDRARYDEVVREDGIRFDARTAETQAPRILTPREVADNMEAAGLECEHAELVLRMAVETLVRMSSDKRAGADEFLGSLAAVRHVAHVLIGRLTPYDDKRLRAAIEARLGLEMDRMDCDRDDEAVAALEAALAIGGAA